MGLGSIVGAAFAALVLVASPAMAEEVQSVVHSRALPPSGGESGESVTPAASVVRPIVPPVVASASVQAARTAAVAWGSAGQTGVRYSAFSRAVEMSPAVVRGMDIEAQPETSAATPAPPKQIDRGFSRPAHASIASTVSSISSDVRCVAMAVFHEARGESLRGQRAVADVVMNRARSGRWGSGACGVVNAPAQFSNRRSWSWPVAGVAAWDRAMDVARDAVSGVVGVSSNIRNFHAVSMGGHGMRLGGHVFW